MSLIPRLSQTMEAALLFGIPLIQWLYLVLLILAGLILGVLIPKLFIKWKDSLSNENSIPHILLDASVKPLQYIFISIGATVGLSLMTVPASGVGIYNGIFLAIRGFTMACIIWFLLKAIDGLSKKAALKAAETQTKLDDMAVPIIRDLAKVFIISVGVLVILQNLGYSVSSLIAGLGIGGAAIALASKDTIANFFGSIVVFWDKPFEMGDWISINGVEGEVCEIRIRTTLIRTVENSIITIPNSQLTSTHIDNFGRRTSRRMDCSFGVYYNTTADQIESIVNQITQHVLDHQDIFTSTYWIAFNGFGDSSLDISVTVYTHETSKAKHMALKQQFLVTIMRIVEANGTGFAFPTRTLDMSALGQQPLRVAIDK